MACRKFHMILPVLLLASAVQPVYRLGAFIESAHADFQATTKINGSVDGVSGKPTDGEVPEPSWPVELIALFPSWIGSCEQTFGAGAGGRLLFVVDSVPSPFCPHVVPRAYRFANLIRAEPLAAALIWVVAHPIHTHAPPSVL
jgi:hypothetical protein